MSRADGILDLVVKAAPFRDLESGIKPDEYRADKPGKELWARRLLTPTGLDVYRLGPEFLSPDHFYPYRTARISLGYAHDRRSFLRPIKGVLWGAPNPVWTYGIIAPKACFIINLEAIP